MAPDADDPDPLADVTIATGSIVRGVLLLACVLAIVVASGFGLLRLWRIDAGGRADDAARVSAFPAPRLQSAPQLERGAAPPAFEQHLGGALPTSLQLRDADGTPVTRATLLQAGRATVIVPAWFRCDTLCGTVAHGALEALADSGVPARDWQLVLFSIDPRDTPADAAALQAVYRRYAEWARPAAFASGVPLRLLTGDAAASRALADAIGFDWRASADADDGGAPAFAHPTGLVVVAPAGTVSGYLFGVRFDPSALRAALIEAREGRIGRWADQLSLLCAHLEPRADGSAVLGWIRLAAAGSAITLLAAAAALVWRRSPRRGTGDG